MNILFTNSKSLGYGGAEISISQYTDELTKRGHNVIIAASQPFKNIHTERLRFVEKWPFFLQKVYLKRKFISIIKKCSIDIITPQDHTTTLPALLAAKQCSIPSVVHIRDYWFACPKSSCLRPDYSECICCSWKNLLSCSKWYRYPLDMYKWQNIKNGWKLIENAEAKIVVSTAVKKKLAACGIKNNVHIIYGARRLEDFQNIKGIKEFKQKYGLRNIVVAFIGSFFYTKGVSQIMKFMPDILKQEQSVSLLLVGDGPLYPVIVNQVKEQNLEKQVIFTGRLPFKDIPLCYAASDILLAPHLWAEPLGATILEASSAGKPSIISEKGGPADFPRDFGCIILPPENTTLWKQNILYLINNPKKRKELGNEAKKNVEKLSMKTYVNRVNEIYSTIFVLHGKR